MLSALVLARILGPSTYGVISAATVYVTLTTLVLDQGLAAALVQRPELSKRLPGAVATANLLTGLALALVTVLTAPLVADFFHAPAMTPLLWVLGAGLVVKAAAITPRAMQQRRLRFRSVAVADIAGGLTGAVVGVSGALLGAGVWAMVAQVLATDSVIAGCLLASARLGMPNLELRELRTVLPFSLRIFATNGLAFFSRNLDNILVGRYVGITALSQYSMAYRVLVVPVQMIGQTVNRVSFPTFARLQDRPSRLAANVAIITSLLAMAAVPPMLFITASAPELVRLVLGSEWSPTAPILAVLAAAGARETVFSVTQSVMRASGAGRLTIRYEWLATVVQLSSLIVGLQFGVMGVAVGVLLAGVVLTPVLMLVQRRLLGLGLVDQLRSFLPPVHVSLWGMGAYLLVRSAGWSVLATALVGFAAYLTVTVAVLWVAHRALLLQTLGTAKELFSGGKRRRG